MPERPPDDVSRRRVVKRRESDDAPPQLEVAALGYDSGTDHAPRVVAQGKGHIAQRIMELAEQHDLPVRQDPTLVSILGALDVGAEVPPDLYGVIAEVLAWAYHADQAAAEQRAGRRRAA